MPFRGRRNPPRVRRVKQPGEYINPPQQHIDKGFDPFMRSPAWKAFRARVALERGEVCEGKEHDPKFSRRVNVELDHIVELVDGGAPLDRDNVRFLCKSCHKKKTNQQKSRRNEREYWEQQS
jgi:5-methylcytosine-specific restriction protein A